MSVVERFGKLQGAREELLRDLRLKESQLVSAKNQLEEVIADQALIEGSIQALKDAKPLLSANSIEQCEKLATSALQSIFNTTDVVKFSSESEAFVIDNGEFETILKDGEGGGVQAVVSFVFNLFLLMKMNKRRFLVFDEQFTQISDQYIGNFFEFLRALSKDLNVDILLITHDKRVEEDMVDRVYLMEEGISKRVK